MADSHAYLGGFTDAERAAFEREVAEHAGDARYYRREDMEALSEAERRTHRGAIEAARRDGRLLSGPPTSWTERQAEGYRQQLLRGGRAYREDEVEAMGQAEREFRWLEIDASVARGDFVRRGGRTMAETARESAGAPPPARRLVFEADLPQSVRDPIWAEVEAGRVEIVRTSVGRTEFERLRAEREKEAGRGR
jgi:hypothetical protein